ncbi:MAG: hypothetical protein JWM10_3117 [Myxococcaceae bacterium]|nr:hypothetical protein [Myxococcaceae bacterium]
MSFGKNPHVAKATAAEQKARAAGDEGARVIAWREAARQWERAAEREAMPKRAAEYTAAAAAAREAADNPEGPAADEPAAAAPVAVPPKPDPADLN